MLSEPITLTFDRKQYHPLGFNSSRVVPPMTLTPVLTSTSDGVLVRSVSAGFCPMPNTLTDVAMVLKLGFEPNGCLPQALRQLAMDPSTASASDGTLVNIAIARVAHLNSGLRFIIVSLDPNGLVHGSTHGLRTQH